MAVLQAHSLRRDQLDRNFEKMKSSSSYFKRPKFGWVKEIRQALGMSMQDLATRLGVIPQRISRVEKDEINGKVTLETMQRAAEAMNCDFVYAFIPKQGSLEETVRQQARKLALEITSSVSASMKLEEQGTSSAEDKKRFELVVKELLQNDRRLWK